MSRNGEAVAAFERAFAEYVGAKYAIALCNGTATLHTALVALGVKPGDPIEVPALTMSATAIAVLHAGARPVFCDVDPATWLMESRWDGSYARPDQIVVSLYGLHHHCNGGDPQIIDDAPQTLRPHSGTAFTSYSFQASKILALGEGGMLVTNDEKLATRAREFSSLGYRMRADQPRIDPAVLKSPTYERHHSLGWNYRMSDLVAERGLNFFDCSQSFRGQLDDLCSSRRRCAALYREAISGCDWLTPQHVPEGSSHDYWTYAVAIAPWRMKQVVGVNYNVWPFWEGLAQTIELHGGERPYAAWRLTYQEPAFRHLVGPDELVTPNGSWPIQRTGLCPVAEDLQPRLLQFQTNDLASAERNADALRKAIREIGG